MLVDYLAMGFRLILGWWVWDAILESTFLSSLIIGLGIAILFTVAYPIYLERLKRPQMSYIFRGRERKTEVTVPKAPTTFELSVVNKNKFGLIERYYWHLIAQEELGLSVWGLDKAQNKRVQPFDVLETNQGKWTHHRDLIIDPLFPGRSSIFPWKIDIDPQLSQKYKVYYYFSTAYGYSPRSARNMEDRVHAALEGGELGELIINVSE